MVMKKTMSIREAQEVAKASGIDGLVEAVATAAEAAWDALVLVAEQTDETGYDVGIRAPSGVIVGLFLDDWVSSDVAVPGGEAQSNLHITLLYFGEASEMSLDDQRRLVGVVGEVVLRHRVLKGELTGTGRFVNGEDADPFWVGVDVPGLSAFRSDLLQACVDAGFVPQGKGVDDWTPHVTVAYLDKDTETPPLEFAPRRTEFHNVTVCVGQQRVALALPADDISIPDQPVGWRPMTKAVKERDELRYTFGPWYVPDRLDAHGEWSDRDELQKALWGYVEKGNRDIRLQHNVEVVAGRWVEAVSWPFEVTVPMTKADGTSTTVTYPAGTPFLGTIWEPWAWELIKNGDLQGYSIGGRSERIEVDLGDGDVEKAFESLNQEK